MRERSRRESVKRTVLGDSGLEISQVVLGSMGHGTTTTQTRARLIDSALDVGITSIDTAPLYGFGEVESALGECLSGRRGRVEVLGKVGLRWDDDHGDALAEFVDASGKRRCVRRDSRPEAIRHDVEESLVRLRCDHIDLCQIHHRDRRVPIADSIGALEDLVDEGKIRQVGVSNFTGPEIESALAALERHPLASDQLEYNLVKRTADREILPLARRHGFGLLAYSPLDAGLLAGRLLDKTTAAGDIEDGRRQRMTFQDVNARTINDALRTCVQPIAREYNATLAEISLAWILHQPAFSAVVVGASHDIQVRENAGAAEITLDDAHVAALGNGFADLALQPTAGIGFRHRARRFLGRVRRRVWG